MSFENLLKQAQYVLRMSCPQIILAGLFLLGFSALPYAGGARPYFVLMAIYYWAIYRPTLVPPILCFGLGLMFDILSASPLGIYALTYVLIYWVISDQRRFLLAQPYLSIWFVFGLVSIFVALLHWGMYGLAKMAWVMPLENMVSVLLSFCLFPFVTLILIRVHRLLPASSSTRGRS